MQHFFNNQLSLKGGLILVLGILALIIDNTTLNGVLQWIGFMLLAFGSLNAVAAYRNYKDEISKWKSQSLLAVIDFLIPIIIFTNLDRAADWLQYFVGFLATFLGLALFFVARTTSNLKPIIVANGLISIVFAMLIFFHDTFGIESVNQLIFFYLTLFGALLSWYGFKIDPEKEVKHDTDDEAGSAES
jgi:uncharacterized membrane protein HdeD (DUF308 family)